MTSGARPGDDEASQNRHGVVVSISNGCYRCQRPPEGIAEVRDVGAIGLFFGVEDREGTRIGQKQCRSEDIGDDAAAQGVARRAV